MLFTQSLRKDWAGTSVDYPSTKSLVSILAPPMNSDHTINRQTHSSPKNRNSTPKHITFADFPPITNNEPMNHTSLTTPKEEQLHDKFNSEPQIAPYKNVYQNPTHTTYSRFKLPPTPLTSPESMGHLGTSTSFSKQQNARSVDGNIQVEVGLKSMFN